MKLKLLFLVILLLSGINLIAQQQDLIALTIDGKPIYRSELERAYNKSNALLGQKEPFDDFLLHYLDFELNLREAQKQQIDKEESFIRECTNFKLAQSDAYLNDTLPRHNFLKNIYDHLLEEREVNHVLLPFGKDKIIPADTLDLYKKALSLRGKLQKNGFAEEGYATKKQLATGIQFDTQSQNGYIGWVVPFMLPYQVEEAIYNLKVGEISMPVRSVKGYHIVQVLDRKPNRGQSQIQQVHYAFTDIPPSQQQIDSVKSIAERAYNKIRTSADFDILCEAYAKAMGMGENGCDFGMISRESKMPGTFVDAVYELNKPGDISKPVLTDYGFHIIRLTKIIPMASFDFMKPQLFDKVRFGDRLSYLNQKESEYLMKEYSFSLNKDAYNKLCILSETVDPADTEFIDKIANKDDVLFTIDGVKTFKVKDFVSYLKQLAAKKANSADVDPAFVYDMDETKILSSDIFNDIFRMYYVNEMRQYAKENLEKKYPDFKPLMDQYAKQLLVFSVKDRNIWTKSLTDEKGLELYFASHKTKYTWDNPKYKGLVIHCKDEKTLNEVKRLSAKEKDMDKLGSLLRKNLNVDLAMVQIERGLWSKGDNEYVDNQIFAGSPPAKERKGFPLFYVTGQLISSPQDFRDDRARVEADYQRQLENEWAQYLKKEYKITANENVLNSIR